MSRHAYLVTAYDNWATLGALIQLIDDPRNDIFVHIDAKSVGFQPRAFEGLCSNSQLTFIARRTVYWADYSQVDAIMDLMESALGNDGAQYSYFHLLSGADLPIQSQDCLHNFLATSREIFVGIRPALIPHTATRVKYYYPLIRHSQYKNSRLLKLSSRGLVELQRIARIDRTAGTNIQIRDGWDWGSFPRDFVEHLVDSRPKLRETFHSTMAPSEIAFNTEAFRPQFRERLHDTSTFRAGSLRYLEGPPGKPRVLRSSDFANIVKSNCLFARKFDLSIDSDIVQQIAAHTKRELKSTQIFDVPAASKFRARGRGRRWPTS